MTKTTLRFLPLFLFFLLSGVFTSSLSAQIIASDKGEFSGHSYDWEINSSGVFINSTINVDLVSGYDIVQFVIDESYVNQLIGKEVGETTIADFYPVEPDGSKSQWTSYTPGQWYAADGSASDWQAGVVFWQYQVYAHKGQHYDYDIPGMILIGVSPTNARSSKYVGKTMVSRAKLCGYDWVVSVTLTNTEIIEKEDLDPDLANCMGHFGAHSYKWDIDASGIDINCSVNIDSINGEKQEVMNFLLGQKQINKVIGKEVGETTISDFYPIEPDGTAGEAWTANAPGQWVTADGAASTEQQGIAGWQYKCEGSYGETETPGLFVLEINPALLIPDLAGTTVTSKAKICGYDWNVYVHFVNSESADPQQQLLFNEIMPANVSLYMDPTNNFSGWVEFYNASDATQWLYGCYLSDDPANLQKYCICDPSAVIASKDFYVCWFDHNDLDLHQTTFKMDCGGGTLYLSDVTGTIIAQLSYPEQVYNTSYARLTEETDEWGICISPTQGSSNQAGSFATNRCPAPQFSKRGGLYPQPTRVNIQCPDGMTIHYTTDGTEPNEGSAVWDKELNISSSTVLRAQVYKEGYIPGPVITQSYLLSDHTISLPVVSIVTDPKNLYDNEIGIYCIGTNGIGGLGMSSANWNCDWARPANIEYYVNGDSAINQMCDISIGGGFTRTSTIKSLKVNAEKKYELLNTLDYPFFWQKPGRKFKSILLRNSGNDFASTMMLDAFQQCLVGGTLDIDYQAYQPAVHFINGEYRGIINLRERNNTQYVYSNYGYDKEEIDMMEKIAPSSSESAWELKAGDTLALQQLLALSENAADDAVYEQLCELMDMDAFIAYLVPEIYGGNYDWPENNIKFFRSRDNGKWYWILYDLDYYCWSTPDYNIFTHSSHGIYGSNNNTCHTAILIRNLFKNATFKSRFLDYLCICAGSIYLQERVENMIDSIANNIRTEFGYSMKAWGESNHFDSNISEFKSFNTNRANTVLSQFKGYYSISGTAVALNISSNVTHATLRMNDWVLPLGYMQGKTYTGRNLTLIAEPLPGYTFKGWYRERNGNETLLTTDAETVQRISSALTVKAYYEKNNDATDYHVRINEISADNGIFVNDYYKRNDWIELYNPTDEAVSLAGLYLSNSIENLQEYCIPNAPEEEVTIPAHGYRIVWADDLLSLSQLHVPFKLATEGECVLLSNFDETGTLVWCDSITYPEIKDLNTFGRFPDGADACYRFSRPSFLATNKYNSLNEYGYASKIINTPASQELAHLQIANGVVRSADNSTLKVYSLKGEMIGSGTTVNLPNGIYIISVSNQIVKIVIN